MSLGGVPTAVLASPRFGGVTPLVDTSKFQERIAELPSFIRELYGSPERARARLAELAALPEPQRSANAATDLALLAGVEGATLFRAVAPTLRALAEGKPVSAPFFGSVPIGINPSDQGGIDRLFSALPTTTTPSLPSLVAGPPLPSTGASPSGAPSPVASGDRGFLGTLIDAATRGLQTVLANPGQTLSTLQQLAQAGIIRGDVGDALTGGMSPVAMRTATPPNGAPAGPMVGSRASFGGSMNGNFFDFLPGSDAPPLVDQFMQLFGGGNGGGLAQCPQLFRQVPAGFRLPSRIQVQGPDGKVYVLANLGLAVRGSRERSTMQRLARDNGFVCRRRRSGGR